MSRLPRAGRPGSDELPARGGVAGGGRAAGLGGVAAGLGEPCGCGRGSAGVCGEGA